MNCLRVKQVPSPRNTNLSKTLSLCLIVALSLGLFPIVNVSAQNGGYYQKTFNWSYGDYEYTWDLNIPKALYDEYKDVPVRTRIRNGIGGYGFLTTTEDDYVKSLATQLNESASEKNFDSFETVSFVLAFVQSLPYTSDNVTTRFDEYPRFPVETLVDDGGDCEDTSVLFATIVLLLGYGAVYLNPPNHLAVGVLGEESLLGYYYTYEEGRYYYCETTGDGWEIGDLPPEYIEGTANIFDIKLDQQYVVDSVVLPPSNSPTPTRSPTQTATTTESPTATQTPQSTVSYLPSPSIQHKGGFLGTGLPFEYGLAIIAVIVVVVVVVVGIAVKPRKSQPFPPPPPPPP